MQKKVELPYFDMLLEALEQHRPGLTQTFGNHVHWGYWGPLDRPDGTLSDFAAAAERLSRRVADAARVRDGARILDVGCGLGGTIESLDRRLSGAELVGLNIDARQLALARERVGARAHEGNRIELVEGDACELPFEDASFDAVLAVECVFHFPDRARFLREARRVLRPGGRLALSDFVPPAPLIPPLDLVKFALGSYIESAIGPIDIRCTLDGYRALGRAAGFEPVLLDDLTQGTLPTYPVLRRLLGETGVHPLPGHFWISALELVSRARALRYVLLAFEAPGARAFA